MFVGISEVVRVMPQPFAIPLTCPKCGRPMTVQIQLPVSFEHGQPPVSKLIACPRFGCNGYIQPAIHGEILAIWPGHGVKP